MVFRLVTGFKPDGFFLHQGLLFIRGLLFFLNEMDKDFKF